MSRKTMIEVSNVTMRFHMNVDRILSLKEFVTRKLSGKLMYEDFTALEHVSFEVRKGETLGLIGRNGAGKSTMLKVISGILKPTEGLVMVNGNVVPMLELMDGGTTVLFVSHSIDQIREMCNKAVWLERGKIRMTGSAEEVCDAYADG